MENNTVQDSSIQTSAKAAAREPQGTLTVLIGLLKGQLEKGPKLRPLHPKSHGLLQGKFSVAEELPSQCQVGVFAKPQTFEAWIRFSNGSAPKARDQFQPDSEGDARGMAIKLKNVAGEKVTSDETDTQDFTLVNHPVFFLKNTEDYVAFAQVQNQGDQPDPQLMARLAPSFAVLKELNSKKVGNPLFVRYWSTTPYKLGDQVIKFAVQPHAIEQSPTTLPGSPDYLREAIVGTITTNQQTVSFDFFVQFFVDEATTPIENPMQEWSETIAPLIKVATLTIPPQTFDTPERRQFDESLSFTPWHALTVHEPLGGINLSRRRIYSEAAKARRASIAVRIAQLISILLQFLGAQLRKR
jgi:hypothetical protein